MDELLSKLQGILGTPEGQQQLQNIQAMLGGSAGGDGGFGAGGNAPAQPAPPSGAQQSDGSGFDFSALAGMLGGLGGGSQAAPSQSSGSGGGFDLSALAGVLNGLGGNAAPAQPQPAAPSPPPASGGLDLSALAGMLGGAGNAPDGNGMNAAPGMPNIDINMIMKLQKVFQKMNQSDDKDTRLLLALKPHFSQHRQAKVDQAMSMMRLFSMMPMLREVFPF